jgi:GT2 family glycosyltransferase
VYGEPRQEVKLLDGVMMAVRSRTLLESDLKFDTRFDFDFYDLDFCRQAEQRGLRMGTWAISIVHESAGKLGSNAWREAYRLYLEKYGEF